MTTRQLIYRHRLVGKRIIAALVRTLPAALGQRLLALAEQAAFALTPQYQSETLPPIFQYWSGRYLAPDAARLGISSPESFFLQHILRSAAAGHSPVRVLSIGAGACSMEAGLAEQLKATGVAAQIHCIDFNRMLMQRASAMARERQLDALLRFQTLDCNQPFTLPAQDVIIVNQFFHHVTALETLCRSLRTSLAADGVLVCSDIIGRNGHQLWPDVETEVQRIWATLPPARRHDRHFNTALTHYRPINHAAYSNEGVRAQDVVGCLLKEFDFELFFSFGAVIVPFIERRVGFNFDPQRADDRALIDHVHALDAAALAGGRYPAANMIATLRHHGAAGQCIHQPVSPQRHAALTRQQLAKLEERG
jgi:SAM-dependent methyltransferase